MKTNKKTLSKLKKTARRSWRKDWRVRFAGTTGLALLGIAAGIIFMQLRPANQHPRNLVWAADKTVKIPNDLVKFLNWRDDCKGYSGTNGPDGVGIWAVYQVSDKRFAKISYGCSTNLSLYIMAVKQHNKWQLLQPVEYFSTTGFLPKCQQIEQYQITNAIEPYCIKDDGNARPNAIK